MAKKIFIIIVILTLLGAGAWFFFIRSTGTTSQPQTLTNVLPFGSGEGSAPSSGSGSTVGSAATSSSAATPPAHLFELSNVPVAGAVAFTSKAGALVVRYMERGTGHIYDIDPVSLAKTEVLNTTIPKVYDAVWKSDGSAVILRTLGEDGETPVTSSVSLIPPAGTSTSDLYTGKTSSLPGGVSEISAGPKNIFYTISGLPQIVTALFDGSKAATVWSAPFTDWRLNAIGDTSVMLTTKASASANGYSYTLPVRSGTPQKLLGPLAGLTIMPNASLSRIAYSYVTNNGTALEALTVSSGQTSDINPATLAEKCVWSQKSASVMYCGVPSQGIASGEPDLWYQGKSHYTDSIWVFDTDTNYAAPAVNPKKDFNLDVDAEKLFLSPNEDYLFFINKNDLTLWALKLN